MNGVEGMPEQVIWVIHNPYTGEESLALDPQQLTQAVQIGQGIRVSSPPPLVPINHTKTGVVNGRPSCTSNSTFSNFSPKQKEVQDDHQDARSSLLPKKNEVLSSRDRDQAYQPATEQAKLLCKFCSSSFETSKRLTNHQYFCPKNPKKKERTRVECRHCHKTFARKVHLSVHLSSKGCDKVPLSRICHYSDCSFKYRFRTVFIEHLRDKHKEDIEPGREMVFDNWDQFYEWKNAEEVRTLSYFSQQFGKKDNRAYFYCQHDDPSRGVEKFVEDYSRKRRPNLKGRIKAGKLCFSMIHVHGVNKEGQLRVTYFPTHSHEPDAADLKFQPANAATREYIKRQIADGVSPEKISERLREEKSALNSNLESEMPLRSDFISVRAIKEQKRQYAKTVNCLEDQETAREIVEDLRGRSYDPVLIFKPAGEAVVTGPESASDLPQDTFILGIQTKEQSEVMKRCCKSALILDVKCDVTHYGCKLLTVFGVDEMNRGYPLAHCIASNMDEQTLTHFFAAMKEKNPHLRVNSFVTTGFDSSLINAASKGLDHSIQNFVCPWSFLKELQRKLSAKVEDEVIASSMFQDLCDLVLADTETEFAQLLTDFRLKYTDQNSSFVRYLNCICVPKKTKWALCFRESIRIDTSLYAESYHSTLKSKYLLQDLNKGLGTLVYLLIETEKEYYAKRWTTGIFTSPSGRETIYETVKVQHTKSLALPEVKQVIGNRLWEVRSQKSEKVHQVARSAAVCTNTSCCYFRCSGCANLCVHLYLCTCKDKNPLCKHIHKVYSANPQTGFREVKQSVAEGSETHGEEIISLLTKLREYVESEAVRKLHPRILRTLSELNAECGEALKSNPKSSETRKPETCGFTPPIDYIANPNDVIFQLDDEVFTLASIKSLEPWLPQPETELLQTAGAFRVGRLCENILNAYLSILSTSYADFTPFDTSVMQSLISSDEETFTTFWESLRTQKVIFIPFITDHYTSAAVLVEAKTVITYDPLAESSLDTENLDTLERGLALAFPQESSWVRVDFPGTQRDIAQSGVNVCVFAEQVARGEVHYLTVNDAADFRKSIYDSIFGYCLKRRTFIHNRCYICKEIARANCIGTIKCVRCSQLFHRMCLQVEPEETCVCPLILVGE